MTVKVEMTSEEFAEFLQFRKTKEVENQELKSVLNTVRKQMDDLSETLLEAVDYPCLQNEKPIVKNEELFNKSVQLANEWFC